PSIGAGSSVLGGEVGSADSPTNANARAMIQAARKTRTVSTPSNIETQPRMPSDRAHPGLFVCQTPACRSRLIGIVDRRQILAFPTTAILEGEGFRDCAVE